jgi:cyclic pyranopterin phosphate synthase
MVDVSAKADTARRAVAEGVVRLAAGTLRRIRADAMGKGDVLGTARLAGIQATKHTAALIPLCHPLAIDGVTVDVEPVRGGVRVTADVRARDRTGVEMEALTAVAVACLTVYDMVKAVDREAVLEKVRLLRKEGGRSGTWTRPR